MRILFVGLLLTAAMLAISCEVQEILVLHGLSIEVPLSRYHMADTLRFTVVNAGKDRCELMACNGKLTYWLQTGSGGVWQDRDSINIGPCDALHSPIVLERSQTLTESLALSLVRSSPTGMCRVRIGARVAGQMGFEDRFSNAFELSN
jgi:hypothetical protein